jgi:aspartyl-tRNA(Asn)/glutamyl-tRNA(Gln) amidotransferase subunit B
MEIVTEPDLRSPEEAGAYVRALQAILRAVGASDGNMEEGSLRCDVNVSVNRSGEPWGTRCEIKNLNSVKFMMAAISASFLSLVGYPLGNRKMRELPVPIVVV